MREHIGLATSACPVWGNSLWRVVCLKRGGKQQVRLRLMSDTQAVMLLTRKPTFLAPFY